MTAYHKILTLFTLSFLTISVGHSADQKKEFYFMGGGGEPTGEMTSYDPDIRRLSSFVEKSNWDSTVAFNGGHKQTEELINTKLSKAKNLGPFTEQNYNQVIDNLITKLSNNEYKKGDQMMVVLFSHGARRNPEENIISHKIALSNSVATDMNHLKGTRSVDLDKLEKLIELAEQKDVKLAIADFSCFSGNTLNLKNNKACLISASGTDQYSWAGNLYIGIDPFKFEIPRTFIGNFINSMKKGNNLEEIFLKSRRSGYYPDYPMISTPEGKAITEMLYKMMTPYLEFNDSKNFDFTRQYPLKSEFFEEQVCTFNKNHRQMLDLLKQYETVADVSTEVNRNEFGDLRVALEQYRDYQKSYEEKRRAFLSIEPEIIEYLDENLSGMTNLWKQYGSVNLLTSELGRQIARAEKFTKDQSLDQKKRDEWASFMIQLRMLESAVADIKNHLSEPAKLKIKEFNEAEDTADRTVALSHKVTVEAKKVYDILYRNRRSETNPCKDFVL